MARSSVSPNVRLQRLEAALPKAKKAGAGGRKLGAEPMSKLLGVKWTTLRGWCDEIPGFEDSDAFIRGGNGIAYEFKPVTTIRFLIRHFKAQKQAKAEKARSLRRAIGGDDFDDVPEDISIEELDKMIGLSRKLREEKQAQGQLIRADKAAVAMEQTLDRMRQALLQAGREQDPTGQWPPEYAEAWREAMDNVMLAQAEAAEKGLKALSGGSA